MPASFGASGQITMPSRQSPTLVMTPSEILQHPAGSFQPVMRSSGAGHRQMPLQVTLRMMSFNSIRVSIR